MIYILSGVAKAGKTLISNEIVKKHKISVFSTDYIMMMLARGNECLDIDTHASDTSVAIKIEPYVYAMIQTMIENNEDYVIEGVHFTTDFSKKLLSEFNSNIRIVYIGYKDISVEEKLSEFNKYRHHMNNPWLFNHSDSIETIIRYMIKESHRIYNECKVKKLKYIDVYDINLQKEEIIQELLY